MSLFKRNKAKSYPGLFYADNLIKNHTVQTNVTIDGEERWVACRPLGYIGIKSRFKMAWLVFTGKADALVWEQQ